MAAAARKPPVETICNCGSIGDRGVKRSARFNDAPDFAQGVRQVLEVLEAMVTNDRVKAFFSKWQPRRIGLDRIYRRKQLALEVGSHHEQRTTGRREAACLAPKIENHGALRKAS